MDYTTLFYWLTVADNAKILFNILSVVFGIVSGVSLVGYFVNIDSGSEKGQAMSRRWLWWSFPICIFWTSLWIFTPSKKDALLIVAGGQTLNFLTTDKSAKQIPSELSGFILTELKNQAKEAAVDLNIKDKKEKILEEAKNLSGKELLEKIKNDSTFAKVVLDKN